MREPTIHNRPPLPPHICSKCRSGDSARDCFIDIGVDTEFEGTIYLCDGCFKDIVLKTPWFLSKEEIKEAVAEYASYKSELETLQAKIAEWNELFDYSYGMDIKGLTTLLGDIRNGKRIDDTPTLEGNRNIVGDESDLKSGESEIVESTVTVPAFS